MKDLSYAFTICFMALGPIKTLPVYFRVTQDADRRTALTLAVRSTVLATLLVLFIALVMSGVLTPWRVSPEALSIAGGILLLMASVRTLSSFQAGPQPVAVAPGGAPELSTRWLSSPVLTPLVTPGILPPVGIVAILYFAGVALGDGDFQARLIGLLLAIMASNFLAMLFARPIMRVLGGGPVLSIVGWVFSALQAGLAIQIVLNALRVQRVTP
jgi:multiple antibiotic resistance protein